MGKGFRSWGATAVVAGGLVVSGLVVCGCGDDDGDVEPRDAGREAGGPDAGPGPDGGLGPDGAADAAVDAPSDAGDGGPAPTAFTLRIENAAGEGFPTPLSPGVWVTHADPNPLFIEGTADRGQGLEALAEDGDPSTLADNLPPGRSGAFSVPVGAAEAGPISPEGAYEAQVLATPDRPNLSFASMVVQSNDVFASPSGTGIPLFDEAGSPLGARDVTAMVRLWNVGTEADQAPRLGPDQAPRQEDPDSGAAEAVIRPFADGTRTIPLARDVVVVDVAEDAGEFTFTILNVSADQGAIVTPISPVFWAVHDETVRVFTAGSPDDGVGLESLAEDGDPAALVASQTPLSGVLAAGAVTTPTGEAVPGPAMPGQTYELTVTPDADRPFLSIATMVVESNDAFVAFPPTGLRLLGEDGAPRPVAELEAAIEQMLGVWDAGTEANEVPGVGPNQAPRQTAPGTGPADPEEAVRSYEDATNDLAGPMAGGFADVVVVNTTGLSFDVTVTNTSDSTRYPGVLTPVLYAVHDDTVELFGEGQFASDELESLAEDGDASALEAALGDSGGVAEVAVASEREGGGTGPLMPGDSYSFSVTMDATNRWLAIASMVVPSNDTFVAFDPAGVALVDTEGVARSDEDIASDVESMLRAWDAGTEANQAGAAGRDQAPRQAGPNTGAAEGDRIVRVLSDPVWSYPDAGELLRVTIEPVTD